MSDDESAGVSRRALVKGTAWSVPIVMMATAAPAQAASVTGFQLNGSCGVLGLLGPGFELIAGSTTVPAGTTIAITSTAAVNANLIALGGTNASLGEVVALGGGGYGVRLVSPLPAGASLGIRWLLSVSLLTTTTATLTLPPDDTAGPGSKTVGTLRQTLVLCTPG